MGDSVYLCSPQYRHGALRDIGAIEALRDDPELLETLRALGLETYAPCDVAGLYDHSVAAVSAVLRSCGLAGTDVDAIIYPSTAYVMGDARNDPAVPGALLEHLVRSLGMPQAVPYGVSFSRCVNTVHAVELGRGLIASGRHRHVLVLAADSMQGGFSRIVDPGISVVSDVAACVLLSDSPRSPVAYRLGALASHCDWSLAGLSSHSHFPDFLRKTVDGMAALTRKLAEADGGGAGDYVKLITNTVNYSVLRIFSQATGFATSAIYSANVPRLGHCDGADLIVNLCDFTAAADAQGRASGPLLAVANGPYMWGGMALRRAP